jgi:hypothetical protein
MDSNIGVSLDRCEYFTATAYSVLRSKIQIEMLVHLINRPVGTKIDLEERQGAGRRAAAVHLGQLHRVSLATVSKFG